MGEKKQVPLDRVVEYYNLLFKKTAGHFITSKNLERISANMNYLHQLNKKNKKTIGILLSKYKTPVAFQDIDTISNCFLSCKIWDVQTFKDKKVQNPWNSSMKIPISINTRNKGLQKLEDLNFEEKDF